MFKQLRLRKIHAHFLESCRSLKEGQDYWSQIEPVKRWILEAIVPIPLLGLDQDGKRILEALRWLESHCQQEVLRAETIQKYHRMVYQGVPELTGQYRKHGVTVIGSSTAPPMHEKVPSLMKQLDNRISEEQRKFDGTTALDKDAVFASAVDLYQRIGFIHPFADANGRVARLAMNHLLRRYHLGYVIFPPLSTAPNLLDALQEANRGHPDNLMKLSKQCLEVV